MGTFAHYFGNSNIPEDIREQFNKQMGKILYYGGMMKFDVVNLFGKEVGLLIPVRIEEDNDISFHYNYFEDSSWESAGFDSNNSRFWSNKIGSSEFNKVVLAAYTLYELYDTESGHAEVNGEIVDTYEIVGWLNHILGTKFSLKNRMRLWDEVEKTALYRVGDYSEAFSWSDLIDLIPRELMYYAGGTEFSDLCYIINGTGSLTEDSINSGTYSADILACKKMLSDYFGVADGTATEDEIWDLLRLGRKDRENIENPRLKNIAQMSLILPARVFVYLISEIKKQDFWLNWKTLHDVAYRDEEMKSYAPAELIEIRRKMIEEPVSEVETSDFLWQGGWFTFFHTPEELKNEPKYYVSDDDRMFWWDGSDEVIISDKTDKWLKNLAERHNKLKETIMSAGADLFIKDFILLLAEIEDFYKRVFPFQNMFYDFVQNSQSPEIQAAVMLLRELSEENKKYGKVIKYQKNSWDLTSRKVTFNRGRVLMKRYMSVMANLKLRKQYFGF